MLKISGAQGKDGSLRYKQVNLLFYIYSDIMANWQKCGKCKSEQEFKYVSNNKIGQLYKTCDKCRSKRVQSTNEKDKITDATKWITQATQKLEQNIKEDTYVFDIETKSTTPESSSIPDEKYDCYGCWN